MPNISAKLASMVVMSAGLRAMTRQGRHGETVALLRETPGDRRAEIVAAAMMPELDRTAEPAEEPAAKEARREPGRGPSGQDDLFPNGVRSPSAR